MSFCVQLLPTCVAGCYLPEAKALAGGALRLQQLEGLFVGSREGKMQERSLLPVIIMQ